MINPKETTSLEDIAKLQAVNDSVTDLKLQYEKCWYNTIEFARINSDFPLTKGKVVLSLAALVTMNRLQGKMLCECEYQYIKNKGKP